MMEKTIVLKLQLDMAYFFRHLKTLCKLKIQEFEL